MPLRERGQIGVDLGFSAVNACDRCRATGQSSWISGVVGVYKGGGAETPFLVSPSKEWADEEEPSQRADFSLYLCRECLKEAIRRTYAGGKAPATIRLGESTSDD